MFAATAAADYLQRYYADNRDDDIRGCDVFVFEGTSRTMSKVRISGGGRVSAYSYIGEMFHTPILLLQFSHSLITLTNFPNSVMVRNPRPSDPFLTYHFSHKTKHVPTILYSYARQNKTVTSDSLVLSSGQQRATGFIYKKIYTKRRIRLVYITRSSAKDRERW